MIFYVIIYRMSKKTFTLSELQELSSTDIIDKIQHKNYSLLKSLGAEKMRREMVPVGKFVMLRLIMCLVQPILRLTKKLA